MLLHLGSCQSVLGLVFQCELPYHQSYPLYSLMPLVVPKRGRKVIVLIPGLLGLLAELVYRWLD